MTIEVPIEAELYSCEVESLKFEADKIEEEYQVGNGPLDITLPKVVQKPTCSAPLTDLKIESVESSLESQLAMAAATLDHAANTLRIETTDPSFFDQTASFLIAVD